MNIVFAILIPLSLLAVAASLFAGVFAMFRGGEFGRRYSNRLMRLRVILQAVAIAILFAFFFMAHKGSA